MADFTTIVSTDELAAHLDDPRWVTVDVRFDLADALAGRAAYHAGHIPGAVFADLNADLADNSASGRGRHPLPAVGVFAERAGAWGIDARSQVVAYDDAGGAFAARLWWLLRYFGHDRAAVLDGGIAKWVAEGRPTRVGTEKSEPRHFVALPREDLTADADEVERVRRDASWALIDSRSPDRFSGANEPFDPVAGRIPGARNRFFKDNLTAHGTLRDPAELRREFERILGGIRVTNAVVYCGSGVTACQNLLALEHAGLTGGRLYPGSWSEWSNDPNRPVATAEHDD